MNEFSLKKQYNEFIVHRDWPNALAVIQKILATRLEPLITLYIKQGIVFLKMRRYREAKKSLRNALTIEERSFEIIVAKLATEYDECVVKHLWNEALTIIDIAIEIHPNPTTRLHRKRGMVLVKTGDYQRALHVLQKVEEKEPSPELSNLITKLEKKVRKQAASSDTVFEKEVQQVVKRDIKDPQLVEQESISRLLVVEDETHFDPQSFHKGVNVLRKDFAHYNLLSILGKGGMGEVYKAYDTKLDRMVALKIISAVDESSTRIERFLREAKATAKLRHPNIIAVYNSGKFENHYYFAMDYIDGASLKNYILQNSPKIMDIVRLMIQIAEAIQFAHDNAIIHRDIKPANIMITQYNVPKVMDFGLAKVLHDTENLSKTGETMGTPAYMSPEQVYGQKMDLRTDIYSLGATLYQAITHRPPFQGENHLNIMYQVVNKDAIPPRTLNPDIPVEIEAICLKCLEKKPQRRYQNVQTFIRDLHNYQQHLPISARPLTVFIQLRKFALRHRTIIAASLLVVISFFCAGIIATVQWWRAEEQARIAQREKLQKEQNYLAASIRLAKIALTKANQAAQNGSWRESGAFSGIALDVVKQFNDPSTHLLRTQSHSFIRQALHSENLLWEIFYSQPPLYALDFSPTGDLLATVTKSHRLCLWDTSTTLLKKQVAAHKDDIYQVKFSPLFNMIATCSADGTIKIWDRDLKMLASFVGHNGIVRDIDFHHSGKKLASASWDGTIKVWDTTTFSLLYTIKVPHTKMYCVSFHNNDLITGDQDGHITIWNGKKKYAQLTGHLAGINNIDIHEDFVVSSSADSTVRVWNIKERQQICVLGKHKDKVYNAIFSDDGKFVFSVSRDRTAKVWEFATKKLRRTIDAHTGSVYNVAYNAKNKSFATTSIDETIKIWSNENTSPQKYHLHSDKVYCIDFDENSNRFASCSRDRTIQLWGQDKATLEGHSGTVFSVTFSPSGRWLASTSSDNSLKIWDSKSAQLFTELPCQQQLSPSRFLNKEQDIALVQNNDLQQWNIAKKHFIKTIVKDVGSLFAFNNSNDYIISATGPTLRIIHLPTNKQVHKHYAADIAYLCFHPRKNVIAISLQNNEIHVFDIENTAKVVILKNLFTVATAMVFHAKYDVLVTGNAALIYIWNIKTQKQMQILSGHKDQVSHLRFIKGDILVSGSWDNSIYLWPFVNNTNYFSFRRDFTAQHIQRQLHKQPQKITEKLFGLRVTDNFTIEQQ
ncbi:WD40 repeat domain-containing serine/threonine-protein kinase [Candidatus Uabimicrobium amorphum]|uniref:non-specific serine/threonine protein kinase n=1 Tax=Uabimicrobium amorphum TaxID=2596890 RepID=A0A5S9IPA5_UABAM|nr:protein kinase [Candidatus Uabimicrobium amorphum]BBM85394.1 protein kinase [Candidatus Uabimicrobium amorphum]